ncbi:MAG: iron-sulfur cluster repair di-iron protein [Acidobacteriota bacterium]
MSFTLSNTVREVAVKLPGATRIFERLGIDYCCGGNRSLNEACQLAQVSTEEVLSSLMELDKNHEPLPNHNWQQESLIALVDFIVQTHHVFTKQEIERLEKLLISVCKAHAQNHPELLRLNELFKLLAEDLLPHMMKEESVLFPYVKALESAQKNHHKPPMPFFGTVKNPVRMMMMEHDNVGELLRIMRTMTNNYQVPADACISYQTLYEALPSFEADLHQHIHLENNVLFPRTLELEKAAWYELQLA